MRAYTENNTLLWPVIKDLETGMVSVFIDACNKARDEGASHRGAVRAGLAAVEKASPDAGDVHVDAPMGSDTCPECGEDTENCTCDEGDDAYNNTVKIAKVDEDQQMVYGWANVISHDGKPMHGDAHDSQDDIIEAHELEKATTEFMIDARKALAMHERDANGDIPDEAIRGMVVHSLPLTADIAKSLGLQCDREGWVVGVKVTDPEIWKRVKSGELGSFSIGGSGNREPVGKRVAFHESRENRINTDELIRKVAQQAAEEATKAAIKAMKELRE